MGWANMPMQVYMGRVSCDFPHPPLLVFSVSSAAAAAASISRVETRSNPSAI